MAFPTSTKYLIVGAGIHGLSTAYHLALELKSKGTGDGSDILVVIKPQSPRRIRYRLWRCAQ